VGREQWVVRKVQKWVARGHLQGATAAGSGRQTTLVQ